MESLVYFLPAVACAGGMVLCVVMMGRMHSKPERATEDDRTPTRAEDDVMRLREEVDALRTELGQRDRPREPA